MQIDQRRLRLECLGYGMKRIAEALDIKPNTITVKLKRPNPDRLYLQRVPSKSVSYWKIHPKKPKQLAVSFIQEGDLT